MTTLLEIYNQQDHQSDKGGKHSYINNFYHSRFNPLRESTKKFCEIGVLKGASMKLWYSFFENAELHGVDKRMKWADHQSYSDRCHLHIGDSTLQETWKNVPKDLDIIIDDGQHSWPIQSKTFEIAWTHLKPGGLYIIEDIMDIDGDHEKFKSLHPSCQVYDGRPITDLFDDVIVHYQK